MSINFQQLSVKNFSDFELLTAHESEGGCYCSFWHQKWKSMADWEVCKKETPEINRNIILEKLKSGFHIGALAYRDDELLAWISVGPLPEFYWAWKRTAKYGDSAKSVAGIMCITVAEKFRGKGIQKDILVALEAYAKQQGWTAIEGYPFEQSAIEKNGKGLYWPGHIKGFEDAGYLCSEQHWLSQPSFERMIVIRNL